MDGWMDGWMESALLIGRVRVIPILKIAIY
jgi:hypothetical protein